MSSTDLKKKLRVGLSEYWSKFYVQPFEKGHSSLRNSACQTIDMCTVVLCSSKTHVSQTSTVRGWNNRIITSAFWLKETCVLRRGAQ